MSNWVNVGKIENFPEEMGTCVKIDDEQVAVFRIGEDWYATQNLCPHQNQMVLSRGIVGCKDSEPKIACPLHKHGFSLKSGEHLAGEAWKLKTYNVKVDEGCVLIES